MAGRWAPTFVGEACGRKTRAFDFRPILKLAALLLALLAAAAAQAGEAVRVENDSKPTACAENDNVDARFVGAEITHFAIEARHPAYLASVREDSTAADFSACDQSHDPSYSFEPLDAVLYEDAEYKLVGHRYSRFWRPESVDFRVGDGVTHGLHLVQLIRKVNGRNIEILVVYPSDGYWRIKPLPPAGVADTAYGSSFLVGPIQEDGRPFVALKSIAFERESLSFRLAFKAGAGELRVAEASPERTRVEVSLPPGAGGFAALRSMFVSEAMADTAEARLDGGTGAVRFPVLGFPTTDATAAMFARAKPSRHNTSAPDLWFGDFGR